MAGTSQLIQIDVNPPLRVPKPEWLRAKAPVGDNFHDVSSTEVRERIEAGQPWEHLVPAEIVEQMRAIYS